MSRPRGTWRRIRRWLGSTDPASPPPRPSSRPIVGAFWFLWNNGRPRHPDSLQPAQGWYSAQDPVAVGREVEQARRAGLDFLAADWWPEPRPGGASDVAMSTLLHVLESRGATDRPMRAAVMVDRVPDGMTVLEAMRRIRSEWAGRPGYQRGPNGLPLVLLYAQAMRQVRVKDLEEFRGEFCFLLHGLRPHLLRACDGGPFIFNPLLLDPPGSPLANLERRYEEFAEYAAGGTGLWAATASPGWRAVLLRDGAGLPGSVRERHGGTLYTMSLRVACGPRPPVLLISTWDEWAEWSGIQETVEHGEKYIALTRDYLAAGCPLL